MIEISLVFEERYVRRTLRKNKVWLWETPQPEKVRRGLWETPQPEKVRRDPWDPAKIF
jgi:hypothetical protein